MTDLYTILGVGRNATADEINHSYITYQDYGK